MQDQAQCACQKSPDAGAQDVGNRQRLVTPRNIVLALAGLAAWYAVYSHLKPFAAWLTYTVLGLETESHLGASVEFFVYDAPKVIMLLTLVVWVVGIINSFFTPERTRALLAGRRESVGNVMAAGLGVLTPFCSCSAVPLFIGFVTAGIPLGVTFSFLMAAPMVNEVALVLLFGLLGWKVALLYLVCGLAVAVVAGFVIGRMGMEPHLQDWVRALQAQEPQGHGGSMTWDERVRAGGRMVKDVVGRVWLWILLGIAVGAGIHGYVPREFMARIMGESAWWSVPLSVVIGIPMYAGAAGIVPVVQALLAKGAALGTTLAFMMSVIALSLPEMLILKKVLKVRLIVVFAATLSAGILAVGFVFNWVV
jgi:uncharacterized membrane protein YraQ (UPF0718 family)